MLCLIEKYDRERLLLAFKGLLLPFQEPIQISNKVIFYHCFMIGAANLEASVM
jgi:hypothetical protein